MTIEAVLHQQANRAQKTILVVGTYDTKTSELDYVCQVIRSQGGGLVSMDVSVLGDPEAPTHISKHQVAEAAGSSIEAAIATDDENAAMQIMAAGASTLARQLFDQGKIDGVLILGGTMGTDLALDVCAALPLGVPKYVVSTVAFSPLIEPGRLSADIQMILWAGGLYGLNSLCKASLSQAAGAVLGAARAAEPGRKERPLIGMTSLGSSCLKYMKFLKPALEERGFEVAIFHSTGMGGMAFESIAREGGFACVMDFCCQELTNLMVGSVVNSGQDRMMNAGAAGIPQMIAPGTIDLIDFAGWQDIPARYQDRPFHEHNRLIKSSALSGPERREAVQFMAERLKSAKAPVAVFLPNQGIQEWDKPGQPIYDPNAMADCFDEMRQQFGEGSKTGLPLMEIDCHINDQAFALAVLAQLDAWIADETVRLG